MAARKPRIAVVTPVFPTSAEKYRGNYNYNIVMSMQRHADIEVICPVAVAPRFRFLQPRTLRYNAVDLTYSPVGVRVKYVPYRSVPVMSRPFNGFHVALKLVPHLKAFQPDLVLAYWVYPEGFGALMAAQNLGAPFVIGALGSDLKQMSDPLSNYLARRTLERSDHVIMVSEEMRRKAISWGIDAAKVTTVLNGCDRDTFRPGDRAEARRSLGIPEDAELALFVGWLAALKGVRELLEAVRGLAQSRPKLMLACIGEGVLAPQVRQLQNEYHGRVRLLGPQTSQEVATWLAASNFLVLPSYSEGCPNVIVEALSCGRPVLATNVGGIPELVKDGCGILIPPRDKDQLADGMARVLSQEWDAASIARKAQRSWHQVADETFGVCEAVIGAGQVKSPAPAPAALRASRPKPRPRITVVTPMFPMATEPYRGSAIYSTVVELQRFADVEVVCPIFQFPQWAAGLHPRSFRYHRLTEDYHPKGLRTVYAKYSSVPVIGRAWNGWAVANAIGAAVARSRPDLILAYWIYPDAYGAMRVAESLRVPCVIGSRGSDMRLPGTISRNLAIQTMKKAAAVLTVSSELRDCAIGYGVPAGRVQTVRNGVDTAVFRPRDLLEVRRTLGVPPDEKLISFVGWLNKTKGVGELIAAMRLLAPGRPDLRVALIGEGPLRESLLAVNDADPILRGRLRILGKCAREEVASWISASDVFCLPSYSEGCPNVLVEALSCGCPVVGTDVGGIPELLTQANGLLAPPYRAAPLAHALSTALDRKWDHQAIAAASRRDWATVAEETFAVCEEVLDQWNSPATRETDPPRRSA